MTPGVLVAQHRALAEPHLGVAAGGDREVGRVPQSELVELGEDAVLDAGRRRVERHAGHGLDPADDAREQEGARARASRSNACRCQRPSCSTTASGSTVRSRGRALAGLEVPEPHGLAPVERLSQRLERGVAHPQPRRVADHGLARLDAERAQLRERALRVGRERCLAPHLGGEAEQRELVGREAHLVGQVVLALRDAVPAAPGCRRGDRATRPSRAGCRVRGCRPCRARTGARGSRSGPSRRSARRSRAPTRGSRTSAGPPRWRAAPARG